MSQSTSPEVLIVGAGPSGLTAALTLLKNGVPVQIIEKIPGPRIGQRGSGITPRSLEVFENFGILSAIQKIAIPVPPMKAYIPASEGNPASTRIFDIFPYKKPTPACPYTNPLLLGQDHLGDIMHQALEAYSCAVERGVELVSFVQRNDADGGDGYIEVKLAKHGAGQLDENTLEVRRYSWVIGADGARGVVRKSLGLTFLGQTRKEEKMLVGDIFIEGLDQSVWHNFGTRTADFLSLRPTEVPSLFSFAFAGSSVDPTINMDDPDTLRKHLSEHAVVQGIKLKGVVWSAYYIINIRMVNKFSEGRVFVTGDAGHIHSPTGGQGMNSGIQDSFNLGWKLALVIRGLAQKTLLDTYTEERIPVIAEMLGETTEILNRTMQRDDTAWRRDGPLTQLNVNYRWSSIVVDEQTDSAAGGEENLVDPYGNHTDGKLRAGDRAPDAPGITQRRPTNSAPARLFDFFSPKYHTILLFLTDENQHADILAFLPQYPRNAVRSIVISRVGFIQANLKIPEDIDFVLEDSAGNAYDREAYGAAIAQGCSTVIIRPDGVVGAFVEGVQGIQRYFNNIFLDSKVLY